jgi:putative sterol carrier protein
MPSPAEILRAHLATRVARDAPEIELSLHGATEALFALSAQEGRWKLDNGSAESPAFVLAAHWDDLLELIEGHASVEAALIDGRLRISGDLLLGMRWARALFS